MSVARRAAIERIYHAAIARVDAGAAVERAIGREDDALEIDGQRHAAEHGVYLIGIGKAAPQMIAAAERACGDLFADGVAVTKTIPAGLSVRSRLLIGSHPVPDERSLTAGAALLAFARAVPAGALVLCLISGGGSALAEAPRAGVTLDDLRRVTGSLLRGGASIRELNAVRARLSALKAGGMLAALRQATVVNLIVSDVLGDDVAAIASGPSVPAPAESDAEDVCARYNVRCDLPSRREHEPLPEPQTLIVANLSQAIDAAAAAARREGYAPFVLSRSLDGEARDVGNTLACVVADAAAGRASVPRGAALLAGGEPVVTVRGNGVGGRNTEGALAAALRLEGVANVAIGFLASDGDDANTGAAGAIVGGDTIEAANRVAAQAALGRNDSYTFLERVGATIHTGPTGTNVNDLIIALL